MFLTVASFLGFTALVAAVAYWKTRNDHLTTSEAYFLGGRSLGAWVIAGSMILTNLSMEHLIGLNGDSFNHGIAVTAWETTAAIAMVVTALFFLPRYLKRGFVTIPQYLAERYDGQTQVIATSLFLLSYVLAILPVVLMFGATGMEGLFEVSKNFNLSNTASTWLIVWAVGTLGSLYAIFGGLKAVAISDTVNGIGFLIIGLMVPVLALIVIGDGNMFAGLAEVYTEQNHKFDITGDEPGSFLPLTAVCTGLLLNNLFFWGTNQSIIQRALGAKSLKEGQKGVLLAAFFKLLGPFVIVLPGVLAYHMFQDTLGPEDYLQAYPMLVKTVLPPAFAGFFAAVMVGAVLSTFNSVLNSSATLFSQGIYRPLFSKNATELQMVRSGRACSIVLALAAMVMAPMIDTSGSLYNYLQRINAVFIGPMLAVILLGFATKRVSALGAKVGLIAGPVCFYLLVFAFGDEVQGVLKSTFGLVDDLHFLHFLTLVFVLTLIVALGISYVRPAERTPEQSYTQDVDITPWRYAKPVGLAIIATTIIFYVALAQ